MGKTTACVPVPWNMVIHCYTEPTRDKRAYRANTLLSVCK